MNNTCGSPVRAALAGAVALCAGSAHADHLSTGLGYAQSAAINTESAVPLERGGWSVGVRAELLQNGELSDNRLVNLRVRDVQRDGVADEDLHSIDYVLGGSLNLAYGFTENLTVGVRLPYVKRNDIREPEEGHAHGGDPIVIHNVIEHGDSAGIGDITVSGMYRFFSGNSSDVAVLFGVKAPTGETNQKGFRNEQFVKRVDTGVLPGAGDGHEHSGRRLETHQQPGSGSWDALLGLAWSRALGPLNLDASALYTYVTEGSQETDLGDLLSYNLALSRALDRARPCDGCSWNLVLELNGEWRDKEDVSGERTDNSGGHLLYLSPGVRLSGPRGWSVAVSAGYPLVKDLNGDQSEPDYRLVGSLGYRF
jgi:hypothetical protein